MVDEGVVRGAESEMNLHSLENTRGARRRPRRVGRGRGSGCGKTCGRGHKGQMSRKGSSRKPGFEGGQMRLVRRIPKRGAHTKVRSRYAWVNVGSLQRFEEGSEVSPAGLRACGLVKGRADGIKVLGAGEIRKKLMVRADAFSAAARAKIEAAGGVCEVMNE